MALLFSKTPAAAAWLRVGCLLLACCLSAAASGCTPAGEPPDSEVPEPGPLPPLRVLVVDDPRLAEEVQRQWEARADQSVQVRQVSAEELSAASSLRADVVLYPSGLLGQLAEADRIVPLPEDALDGPQLARRDVFPVLWQTEARWGGEIYAVPLGSPQFCLLYRTDVLETVGGEPPADWSEYLELAGRLAEAGSSDNWDALAEPLAPGWAGQVLLARAAPYARHRSFYSTLFAYDTMEPLIAGPPFVRALEQLVAAYEWAPPESLDWTPGDVRQAFFSGRLAMGLTWPSSVAATASRGEEVPTGFAELPGSSEVYNLGPGRWEPRGDEEPRRTPLLAIAGRLGSVTSEARRPAAAAGALAWIAGKDLGSRIAGRSPATTLFRKSQRAEPRRWVDPEAAGAAEAYAELVEEVQSRSLVLTSPRIPGRARYLAALDRAVRAAVQGEAAPREALAAAAGEWERITDDLGRESQREAYARSLGLQP